MTGPDTHDIHTLTGAYAAGALPDAERRAFEDHLDQCPSCRQEVDGLVATTARLGAAVASPAPSDLRRRVLAEIANVRQVSPVVAQLHDRNPPVAWFRQPLGIAASALLIVALGLGALAGTEHRRADDAERVATRVTTLVTDPDAVRTTRPIASGGDGMVIRSDGQAVFRADGVDQLPAGRAYQLWRLDKGGAHSLGVLGRGNGGSVQHFVDKVHASDRLGLTVEPSAGSQRPTTDPVLILPMPA